MHVAINAQLLSDAPGYRSAGVSNYARHLLAALGQTVQEGAASHRLTAFVHTASYSAPGISLVQTPATLEQPLRRILWEQARLPRRLAEVDADVVHGLVNVLPLATRRPGVVTVHDLSFLRFPNFFPPFKRWYLAALCRVSVARAAHVLAVSRQTAADLGEFFGLGPARISVAPNGVDGKFHPGREEAVAQFRRRQGLPPRYWLYLGTLEPRKNLLLLLEAFARWRRTVSGTGSRPDSQEDAAVQLVVAGGKGWYFDAIFQRAAALGLADAVRFPGYVDEADLPNWYRGAELFLFPSRFEGFGLPVAEAMACGTPVLCSDAPGVREVAGPAAMMLPVNDVDAWAAGMAQAASQPQRRAILRAAGLAHVQQYTWRRAAETTLAAYEQAYQPRR